MPTAQRAMMGYLPQLDEIERTFPVSVTDVVMMGRYPRIGWSRRARAEDRAPSARRWTAWISSITRDTQIGRLSGGQLQRALLARVLAQDPAPPASWTSR